MPQISIQRGWLALLFCLLPFVAVCQSVKSLPKPNDYVSDFAHVLSPGVVRQLDYVCGEVDHEAHAQIAVVTVNTLAGEEVQNYAVELYQAWGLGAKSGTNQDRGVLILVAVQDRKRFIATGYGLEGILPDAVVGQIGRAMVPYLRSNDFDGAMKLAVGQIAQIIAADAGVKLTPLQGQAQPRQVHLGLGQLFVLGIVLLLIILFLARFGGSGLIGFLLGMFLGGGWGGRGGDGGDGGGGGGDGFGGFGGGSTGGGGAGGSW